jgi:hypothetical protein
MTAQLYGWLTIVFFLALLILLVVIIIISRRREISPQSAPTTEMTATESTDESNMPALNRVEQPLSPAAKIGSLECRVSDEDGDKLQGVTCTAQNEQTKQEYMGHTNRQGSLRLKVPYGSYVVTIKAPQYGTRVEAVQVGEEYGHVSARLEKIEERHVNKASCPDTWLHEIAERDRRQIEWAVKLLDCELTCNTTAVPPYLQFRFKIFNGSVYYVSIERKIGGFITYGDRRLKGDKFHTGTWKNENLQPRYVTTVEIRQELTEEEATLIATARNEQRFHEPHISFKQLEIVITADADKNVTPRPLWFESISGISLDGKVR